MCLGIPVKITEINREENSAICEYKGVKRKIDIRFVPDVKVNEYVILHAGFAIQKVNPESAQEIHELLNQFENPGEK
jgi:hydrogenase expression/formation protein HypC